MTDQTPIERAGNALMRNRAYQAGVAFGVPDEAEAEARHRAEIIKAVLDSIDTEQLADTLVRDLTYSTGLDSESNDAIARTQARAVAEWLATGERLGGPEQQLGPARRGGGAQ